MSCTGCRTQNPSRSRASSISPGPWSPGTSAFFEPILRESRHDLFWAPRSIPCFRSIHVIWPCSRRSLRPGIGRLCAPNAAANRGHDSNSLSLERSGSISELYIPPVTCGGDGAHEQRGGRRTVGGSEKAAGRRPTSFRTCAAKLTSPYQSHFLKRSSSPSAHARATA